MFKIKSGKIAKAKKVVIYGPEGIGKSTFASKFPDPLFIDTEGSTSSMDVKRLDKPSSLTMLYQQIDYVKQNKPCKTLVIDTIDWAERLEIEHICNKANKDSITKFGYGEGFIQLEEETGRLLNRLSDLIEIGINVVLTAHAKIVKFEQPDELGAYDRYELKLGNKTTAKTSNLVKEWADMVLFANYKTISVAADDKGNKHKAQGGKRMMYTSHHPCWDAKNRDGLPDECEFDYNVIAHLFPRENTNLSSIPQQDDKVQELNIANDLGKEKIYEIPKAEEVVVTNEFEGLPQALLDLMKPHNITAEELKNVVASRGYYTIDTPFSSYDPNFIQGVLISAWEQVWAMIEKERILTF